MLRLVAIFYILQVIIAYQEFENRHCTIKSQAKLPLPSSPFVIPNPSLIGKYNISIPIPKSLNKHCCATNYTAAWDVEGNLLALAIDNFLCSEFVQNIEDDALLSSSGQWDTYEDLLYRKNLYTHPNKEGDDILRAQNKYTGFFPGQTKLGVSEKIQLLMRECLDSVIDIVMESPMFENVEKNRIPKKLLSKPIYLFDTMKRKEEVGGESEPRYQHRSIPVIPILGRNFYATVSMNEKDMHLEHRWPHPDSLGPGLASVYTITKDKRFDVTGTSIVYQPGTNISLISSSSMYRQFRWHAKRVGKDLNRNNNTRINTTGWTSQTSNIFATSILIALNKHNRITLYPWNRLHFAHIPKPDLLHSNPLKGRLTLNSFWDVFGDTADDSKSYFCQKLNQYYNSFTNDDIGQRAMCKICTSWRHCVWCSSAGACVGREEVTSVCPILPHSPPIAAYEDNNNGITTTICSSVNVKSVMQQTSSLFQSQISIYGGNFTSDKNAEIMFQIQEMKIETSESGNKFIEFNYNMTATELLSIRQIELICFNSKSLEVRRKSLEQWITIVEKVENAIQEYKNKLKSFVAASSGTVSFLHSTTFAKERLRWVQVTKQQIIQLKMKIGKCLQLLASISLKRI